MLEDDPVLDVPFGGPCCGLYAEPPVEGGAGAGAGAGADGGEYGAAAGVLEEVELA